MNPCHFAALAYIQSTFTNWLSVKLTNFHTRLNANHLEFLGD